MYSVVKESLGYVKEVVLFMNFEVGDHIPSTAGHGDKGDRNEPQLEVPSR